MGHLVSPTVLVVDDNGTFGNQLKRELLDLGSIGALFVENLGQAADLIEDQNYRFDAVLTDWYFETGDDPDRKLYDGLDLIKFVHDHAPLVETYLLTAHGNNPGIKAKLAAADLDSSQMFNKSEIAFTDEHRRTVKVPQPWNVVRRDVLMRRIEQDDPALYREIQQRSSPSAQTDEILAKILEKSLPPTITYIQNLGSRYRIKAPIEVICVPAHDGSVKASAPKLGILVSGFGDTPTDAVNDLREIIVSHAEELLAQDDQKMLGYAKFVRDEILKHVDPV